MRSAPLKRPIHTTPGPLFGDVKEQLDPEDWAWTEYPNPDGPAGDRPAVAPPDATGHWETVPVALPTSRLSGTAGAFVDLAVRGEFPEYVDPLTGEPHGTRHFSWTAALTLDLLAKGAAWF